jgi:hypothetical protein
MERLRRRQQEDAIEPLQLPAAPPALAQGEAPVAPATVQVIWGPIAEHMAIGGMTVGEARALLQRAYNIPPQAAALVNGHRVPATRRLTAGEVLEFARQAGEKGATR